MSQPGDTAAPARLRPALPAARLGGLALALALTGCTASQLNVAREHFYGGHFGAARREMAQLPGGSRDRVLYLMERGMMRQAAYDHKGAICDWLEAAVRTEQLEVYSVSEGAVSLISNDNVMTFKGAPYERVLLHAFTAKSYMARGLWEDAAVEGRNIIHRLKNLDGFPDDAYSRYVAALSLESIGDHEGARFQYKATSKLLTDIGIDEYTGRFHHDPEKATGRRDPGTELVCFVAIGRSPTERGMALGGAHWAPDSYAEFLINRQPAGRSYALADTAKLLEDTEKRLAAIRVVKESARILIKDAAGDAISQENEMLGELVRWILFSLEVPDARRWETLPLWLHVARMPCPDDLESYTVRFRSGGRVVRQERVTAPLTRFGNTYVSFCRAN